MTYNHGIRPNNSSLIYYLLPTATPEFLNSYSNLIDISTENNIHRAYHNDLKILALNFFQKGSCQNIEVNRELSYIQKQNNDSYNVAFSDLLFSDTPIILVIKEVKSFKGVDIKDALLEKFKLSITIDTTKNIIISI